METDPVMMETARKEQVIYPYVCRAEEHRPRLISDSLRGEGNNQGKKQNNRSIHISYRLNSAERFWILQQNINDQLIEARSIR
jgi:hypothetical protein